MNPSTASKFRAEFPQAATPSNRSGPRILELDGYSTLIPERSTLVMSLLARTFHKPSTTTTELTVCQSLPLPGALSGSQHTVAPAVQRKATDGQRSTPSRYEVGEMSEPALVVLAAISTKSPASPEVTCGNFAGLQRCANRFMRFQPSRRGQGQKGNKIAGHSPAPRSMTGAF